MEVDLMLTLKQCLRKGSAEGFVEPATRVLQNPPPTERQ